MSPPLRPAKHAFSKHRTSGRFVSDVLSMRDSHRPHNILARYHVVEEVKGVHGRESCTSTERCSWIMDDHRNDVPVRKVAQ